MTMIDAHVHVFAKVSAQFPRDVDEVTPAESEATAEQLLQQMPRQRYLLVQVLCHPK